MQALQRLALALTVATLALLAPVAQAQGDSVQYAFRDQDGWGKCTIKTISRVSCSNMVTCQCWVEQNGWILYGTGCISDDGTISCTWTHKIPQCGCGDWQAIPCIIFVCRPGYSGSWHKCGEPQNWHCCELRCICEYPR
jgi:hypothetical protein